MKEQRFPPQPDQNDRTIMEEWCFTCGRYSLEYYRNLSDEELENAYHELVIRDA